MSPPRHRKGEQIIHVSACYTTLEACLGSTKHTEGPPRGARRSRPLDERSRTISSRAWKKMRACVLDFRSRPSFAVSVRFRYSEKWGNKDMCDFSNAFGMDTIVKVPIVLLIQVQQLARFARRDSLPLPCAKKISQGVCLIHHGIVSGFSNISSECIAVVDTWEKHLLWGWWRLVVRRKSMSAGAFGSFYFRSAAYSYSNRPSDYHIHTWYVYTRYTI